MEPNKGIHSMTFRYRNASLLSVGSLDSTSEDVEQAALMDSIVSPQSDAEEDPEGTINKLLHITVAIRTAWS